MPPASPMLAGAASGASSSGQRHHHRLRDWLPTLAACAVMVWITCGLVLAARLSLFQRWSPSSSPFLPDSGLPADPAVVLYSAGRRSQLLQQRQQRTGTGSSSSNSPALHVHAGQAGTAGIQPLTPTELPAPTPPQQPADAAVVVLLDNTESGRHDTLTASAGGSSSSSSTGGGSTTVGDGTAGINLSSSSSSSTPGSQAGGVPGGSGGSSSDAGAGTGGASGITGGGSSPAQATSTSTFTTTSTTTSTPAKPAVFDDPTRLSGLGQHLTDAELHGGWNLTWEVFDRATKHPNATVVSWAQPRVLLIRDFLSPEEVEHLVRQATGGFERSQVVSDDSKQNDVRTSFGSWLNGDKRDDKVREVQHRIHSLIGIPEAFGESIYVLQYSNGQKYDPHTDHCAQFIGDTSSQSCRSFLERAGGPNCGPGGGGVTCGDRLATFILYLRSPTKGGATVFPRATAYRMPKLEPRGASSAKPQDGASTSSQQSQQQPQQQQQGTQASSSSSSTVSSARRRLQQHGNGVLSSSSGTCADVAWYCRENANVLQVAPPPGSAVLFWDYIPAGSSWQAGDLAAPDPTSLHGGCPVLEGTKLIATRWIRAADFH